jgi:hypothetical protein
MCHGIVNALSLCLLDTAYRELFDMPSCPYRIFESRADLIKVQRIDNCQTNSKKGWLIIERTMQPEMRVLRLQFNYGRVVILLETGA